MKFIADTMLGALARWLRTIGYDTRYVRDADEAGIIETATSENRIILTRDTRLIRKVDRLPNLFINHDLPLEQLKEVIHAYKLSPARDNLFSICIRCNSHLREVDREEVKEKVPEYIFNNFHTFHLCPACCRIYWPGSHKQRVIREIKTVVKEK